MTTPDFAIDRTSVPPFRLKEFLNSPTAAKAKASLSSSFAELVGMSTLAQLDPTLMGRLEQFNGGYPGANGSPWLREAIAGMLGLEANDIIVTNGADEAVELVYKGLLERGDVVSLVEPAYGPLRSLALQRGARVLGVPLDESSGWRLGPTGWNQLLAGSPRLVALNLPHNPTGWMPSAGEIDDFCTRAQRANALVLFDEIYAGLDPERPGTIGCLAAERAEVITVGGLSKAFGLPGLHVGWVASRNARVIQRLAALRLHGSSFVSALTEMAALSAVKNAAPILSRNVRIARANRDHLVAFVARRPDLWSLVPPSVGVVAFARWLGPGTASALSARVLQQIETLLVPGPLFDFGERHVRFGFGASSFAKNLANLADLLATA